jgi:hypothetical protein
MENGKITSDSILIKNIRGSKVGNWGNCGNKS